ncbi:hypothetical protein [Mongoliitalea daihaiensis]|nr:hypothetical protein [Mongoliitalea daihaiensis]
MNVSNCGATGMNADNQFNYLRRYGKKTPYIGDSWPKVAFEDAKE